VAIEEQEDVGSDESDPLASVQEGVVLDQAESIGGRKIGKVRIGLVPPTMPWPSEGGDGPAHLPKGDFSLHCSIPCRGRGTLPQQGARCGGANV